MKITIKDYIKANKIASREMELENSTGWYAKDKAFINKKAYKRKKKYKEDFNV